LSSYDGVAGNGSGGDFTQWTYDRFGNRLTELHSLPNTTPDPMQYYTVGSDNRLLGVSDRKLPRQGHRPEVDFQAAMVLGK
jgi:hypothetical protein